MFFFNPTCRPPPITPSTEKKHNGFPVKKWVRLQSATHRLHQESLKGHRLAVLECKEWRFGADMHRELLGLDDLNLQG